LCCVSIKTEYTVECWWPNLALLSQFTQRIKHWLHVWHSLCDAVTIVRIDTSVGNAKCVLQDLPQSTITYSSSYYIATAIGIARGCRCTPSATKNFFLGIFVGMRAEFQPHFKNGLNLVRGWWLQKGRQIFGQEESAPPRENPGYAYGNSSIRSWLWFTVYKPCCF